MLALQLAQPRRAAAFRKLNFVGAGHHTSPMVGKVRATTADRRRDRERSLHDIVKTHARIRIYRIYSAQVKSAFDVIWKASVDHPTVKATLSVGCHLADVGKHG